MVVRFWIEIGLVYLYLIKSTIYIDVCVTQLTYHIVINLVSDFR